MIEQDIVQGIFVACCIGGMAAGLYAINVHIGWWHQAYLENGRRWPVLLSFVWATPSVAAYRRRFLRAAGMFLLFCLTAAAIGLIFFPMHSP